MIIGRLALETGCDFVHLGQGDLDGADLAALRRAGVRLGISTHDESELERALALAADYVALGPIYPTLLKAMPWAPQGLARLGEWKRHIGALPLVAIGGLTLERLPHVFAAGADIAAVVTDIVRAAQPEERVQQWLRVRRRGLTEGHVVNDRYARQRVLPQVGTDGQSRLAGPRAAGSGRGRTRLCGAALPRRRRRRAGSPSSITIASRKRTCIVSRSTA